MNATSLRPASELSRACAELGIAIQPTFLGVRDHANWDGQRVRAWDVTLRRGSTTLRVPFYQGLGHKKAPTAADVLSCLLSDASAEDARSFEGWCSDYGHDTDSRKAKRIYKECLASAKELRSFLGEHFETLRGKEH